MIDWRTIQSPEELTHFETQFPDRYILIYKHSFACGLSGMARHRLENHWEHDSQFIPIFVDVHAQRRLSNQIEKQFKVRHESPQVLLIRHGECLFHTSHHQISLENILAELQLPKSNEDDHHYR